MGNEARPKAMRVLYDHQVFSLQNAGGAARYHYELIAHLLSSFDLRLELVLGFHNSIYPFSSLSDPRLRVTGIRTALLPGVKRYALNEAVSNLLAAARGKYDIYHPTLYRSMPLVRSWKTVVTHHDCAHERFPHMFRNAALITRKKRELYSTADAIICVSESSRRDLLHYYEVNPARAFVVYHGINPFAREGEAAPQTVPMRRPYLLFVGFRETYKNFAALLAAYAASEISRDYDLLAVGGGEFSPQELASIKDLGVAPYVHNLQRVSDSNLAALYRAATLFVYPSLYEGFGFPPLEAMSSGCPVLVSSTSSLPEVCGDAACFFNPENEDGLRQSLVDILNDPGRMSVLRDRGIARAARFDWSDTAIETYRIYSNVLNH